METKELFETVAHVIRIQGKRLTEASSKRDERIKGFAWIAEKTISGWSSSSSESSPTDISGDGTNEKAYSVMDYDEEECFRRKTENRDRHAKQERKIKKSNFAYKSSHVTMLKVIKLVDDLYREAFDDRAYNYIEQLAWFGDEVAQELFCMAK